jgi:anti-sigma28 factor (negative regulator of flagellin synthesis)
MPTSKKASKKTAAKKVATKKTDKKTVAAAATVKLNFPIDAEKAEAIKRCLAKGSLTVTMSKADLGRARLGDPYKYD